MIRAAWIEHIRHTPVLTIATALGLRTQPARGASGGSIFGCPACAATRRHPSRRDRRGAIGVRRDGRGWQCHECTQTGDGLDLISWARFGRRCSALSESQLAELRTWVRDRLLGGSSAAFPPAPPAEPAAPPHYPDENEVAALLERCVRADEVVEVREYLKGRAIDAGRVADLDLARALPDGVVLPDWASRWDLDQRRSLNWLESGHQLIVPMVDAEGRVRSLLARCVRATDVKSLAPSSFERRGLIMADGLARQVLTSAARPQWWPMDRELRMIVGEGEPDYLTIATAWGDSDECAPATLAVVNGGWLPEFAQRIPNRPDVTLVVATHSDASGERYAAGVLASFAGRAVRLERKRWSVPEAAE